MQQSGKAGDGKEAYDESEYNQADLFSPAMQLSYSNHADTWVAGVPKEDSK